MNPIPNIADVYPLSPMQQGMLFHSMLAPHSGVYVEIVACRLRGTLDEAAFRLAWQRVIDRHPILRTAFLSEGLKEPVQIVHQHITLVIQQDDWRAVAPTQQRDRLAARLEAEQAEGFRFDTPPLMRLALIRLSEDIWQFVWVYHHILMDGWSNAILFQEMLAFYQAALTGHSLHIELPRSYRDYILWLKRQDQGSAEAYWRKQLTGLGSPTPLVACCARHPAEDEEERYEESEVWLDAETTRCIQTLAARLNVTLNTLVCGAWGLLISRYCGEEEVCFGVTVSGRPPDLPGAESMVGLFINTLPIRLALQPTQPVQTWLQALQTRLVEMRQFEYSPLSDVHGWSQVPRSQPLFESILVYENFPTRTLAEPREGSSQLVIDDLESIEMTNYPITAVAGTTERLMLKIVYDARQFAGDWARRLLGHWARVLEAFAATPTQPLGKICLLTRPEYRQMVIDWNQNHQPFPEQACIHELFDQQVARDPQATAIDFESQVITYGELHRRANRLAHFLIEQGVGAETRVGLCFERSVEMIIAMLAVLKAGGAYLPLDPAYPPERLAFMIADSNAGLLLTHSTLVPSLPAGQAYCIALDAIQPALGCQPATAPSRRAAPDALAYLIYTSGSTGRPKGVLLAHRGLCNLITQYAASLALGPGGRMLQFFSYSFDGSVADIFVALCSGATLCMGRPESLMPGDNLARFLREQRVTHGMLTPSALSVLPSGELPDLQVLLTGGELCTRDLLEPWNHGRRLINAYGPTEATVISTLYEIQDLSNESQAIPIGRPLPNTVLYILDSQLNPAPAGIAGEIYIGGAGLARGYLDRPELTTERFQPDPFSAQTSARLYRTGDLGRFRPDGVVEFLGRVDDQVKIRGFRIELGEIEAALRNHPLVAGAVVAALPDPAVPALRQLVAYIVPRENSPTPGAPSLNELQVFLRQTLPDYMLPRVLVLLPALPLTPSGKVNRKALPAPDGASRTTRREYAAPRDSLEASLCQIWEEVLNTRPVGVQDSFFDLGGHSLLAVRMVARMKAETGHEINLITLFQAPTIELLANALRRAGQADVVSEVAAVGERAVGHGSASTLEPPTLEVIRGPDSDEKILIPLQARGANPALYFVHPSGGSTHWYLELAAALGKDQPSYGFQARGVDGDRPLHSTVPAMAAFYVQALQNFQPRGPYRLASWSLGVIIAYEMAQILVAQGETVECLAMLDQGPVVPYPKPLDDADYLVQTFGQNIPLDAEALRCLPPEEQIARVLAIGKKRRFIYPEIKLAEFSHFVNLMKTQVEAWRSYEPRPYPGRIILFRAASQDHPANLGPDLGWESLALGGVDICSVPGDHLSMIHKPHVRKLAEELKKHLAAGMPAVERMYTHAE